MATPVDLDRFPAYDHEIPEFLKQLGLDGLIDFHVHLMPESLQQAVWSYFDRLDSPPWPITYRCNLLSRIHFLSSLGVLQHTALAYAHKPGMVGWLNDFTLDLAERYMQVIATFTIFPEPDVAAETSKAILRGGRVVKVHTQVGKFHLTDPQLKTAWQQISDSRIPVLIHATAVYGVDGGRKYCGIDAVRELLDCHPELIVVLAHLGQPEYLSAFDLAESTDRVFLELSMALVGEAVGQDVPCQELGRLSALSDKLIFGSDFPAIPHTYSDQIRGLSRLELTPAELRSVLMGNARRLLHHTT